MKIGSIIGWDRANHLIARFEGRANRPRYSGHDDKICYPTIEAAERARHSLAIRAEREGRDHQFRVYACDVWSTRHFHVGHINVQPKARYGKKENANQSGIEDNAQREGSNRGSEKAGSKESEAGR